MANLITLARFVLLFVLVASALQTPSHWQLLNAPLLIFIIALDGLDGYVARRRGETSAFGSVFDIVVDRIVENVTWIVLAHLQLVPLWVVLLFITRGVIVDSIRAIAIREGETPFGMMQGRWGRAIVSSRASRALYGGVKILCFGWLFFFQPWPALFPNLWISWQNDVNLVSQAFIFATVVMCVIRALPVVVEYLWASGVVTKPKIAAR